MVDTAIAQGVIAEFAMLQDYGMHPIDGDRYVCSDVASRGMLLKYSSLGVAALVSGDEPATVRYLGFVEQDVVADASQTIDFGYKAQQQGATINGVAVSGDLVAIHRAGIYRVTSVSGTVADGALIYPGNGGKVQSAQVGSAPAIGWAHKGNGGVAGDPIEMEVFLIGHRHTA